MQFSTVVHMVMIWYLLRQPSFFLIGKNKIFSKYFYLNHRKKGGGGWEESALPSILPNSKWQGSITNSKKSLSFPSVYCKECWDWGDGKRSQTKERKSIKHHMPQSARFSLGKDLGKADLTHVILKGEAKKSHSASPDSASGMAGQTVVTA